MDLQVNGMKFMLSVLFLELTDSIFGCIAELHDVNGAHGMYAKMKELKCLPNTLTYNILMRMFVDSKSIDMVLKLKKEMDENQVEPNVNTYRILIMMFCEKGHWSNAYKFMREMVEEKSLKPNLSIYEMVLELLRKAGQLKSMKSWSKRWFPGDSSLLVLCRICFVLDNIELNKVFN